MASPADEHHDPTDDDHRDGCEIPEHELEDEDTADLRVLFPQGLDTPDIEAVATGYRDLAVLDA